MSNVRGFDSNLICFLFSTIRILYDISFPCEMSFLKRVCIYHHIMSGTRATRQSHFSANIQPGNGKCFGDILIVRKAVYNNGERQNSRRSLNCRKNQKQQQQHRNWCVYACSVKVFRPECILLCVRLNLLPFCRLLAVRKMRSSLYITKCFLRRNSLLLPSG